GTVYPRVVPVSWPALRWRVEEHRPGGKLADVEHRDSAGTVIEGTRTRSGPSRRLSLMNARSPTAPLGRG
ncbi:MAG: hypothetical protein WB608_16550, partial [Terracidiphilus sp.]